MDKDYVEVVMKAYYIFDPEPLSEGYKDIIKDTFHHIRGLAVNAINPRIEQWNKEFDDKFGPLDNYDCPKYNKFIANKQQEILDIINDAVNGDRHVLDLKSDDECDIYGVTFDGYEIHMYLKEAE